MQNSKKGFHKKNKIRDRDWFRKGNIHGLKNRISDFEQVFEIVDVNRMTAIDIGSAEGDITQYLAERFRHVHAIELMQKSYDYLYNRFKDIPNVTVSQEDIEDCELQCKRNFDFVFLLGVLHYFDSESIRKHIIRYCLEITEKFLFIRTAIQDFRIRDKRRTDNLHRYTHLSTISELCNDSFNVCVIDNGYRNSGNRLGDLIIYRRKNHKNNAPELSRLFKSTKGYMNINDTA